jgi:hypothetical protein
LNYKILGGNFPYKNIDKYVVSNEVEYIPGDEEQSLLLTHGLIKTEEKDTRERQRKRRNN